MKNRFYIFFNFIFVALLMFSLVESNSQAIEIIESTSEINECNSRHFSFSKSTPQKKVLKIDKEEDSSPENNVICEINTLTFSKKTTQNTISSENKRFVVQKSPFYILYKNMKLNC